jgi:prophage DNA circulation protein
MADWRDSLQEGSIAGVPLFIQQVTESVGRRTTSKSMPFRDTPSREDLGRQTRRYRVVAMVIGNEYMAARDAVREVFETPGPWIFTHPFRGEISVILDEGSSVDIAESFDQGGMASFNFSLVESGDPDSLRVTVSTAAALAVASTAVIDAAMVDAEKKLAVGDVFNAISSGMGAVTGGMLSAKRKVMGTLGVTQLSAISDTLTDINSTIGSLANSPFEILTALNGLVAAFKSIFTDQSAVNDDAPNAGYPGGPKKVLVEAALANALDLCAIETVTPPVFVGGPVDEEEVSAQKAIKDALKAMVIASNIDLVGNLPLESVNVAVDALGTLGSLADGVLTDPDTSDDVFVAMTDLRSALDAHLSTLTASLPRIQEYIPPQAMPALLIAFQFYGDPTRDLEIVGRNRVKDPNFVPGGDPLELLIDV